MRHRKALITFILFTLFISIFISPIRAQQTDDNSGAELSILPIGDIEPIIPNQENTLKLKYYDNFGMNWTQLQYLWGDRGIRKILSFFIIRGLWPIIHPTWTPFLGYTSINLDAEIVGNKDGWTVSVNPNTIPKSTDGTTADLTLKMFVNDLAVDNTVIVRISATRILKDGTEYGTSYFEIPVRSIPLDYIDIVPDSDVKTVPPDSTATFQIEVTNLGYFVDTFAARVSTNTDVRAVLSEQSFVLQPGETREITLQVMTPETFFDAGTTHTINITAYSLKNPEYPGNSGGVQVITRGFFVSQLIIITVSIFISLAIIIYLTFTYLKKRKDEKLYGKPPVKPWTLPENKQKLKDLIEKDKDAYRQELQKMKDDYRKQMDSYARSRKQKQQKQPRKPILWGFIQNIKKPFKLKQSEQTKKEKTASKQTEKQKKKEEPMQKGTKEEEQIANKEKEKSETPNDIQETDNTSTTSEETPSANSARDMKKEADQRRRNKQLEKIKRKQEKQRKKLKK